MTTTPATLNSFKTENQIYKDFKSCVEAALLHFGITGWEVKKLNQVIKTEDLKPAVFIQLLAKKQVGAQWRKNVKTAIQNVDKFSKSYFARKEITIRFSATRRPLITDTADTYNGIDILTLIRSYFLSLNGINTFAAANYAQYRATDIQTQSFSNDDENIQLMPYFDCDYIYTDDFADTINKIDDVQEKDMEGV